MKGVGFDKQHILSMSSKAMMNQAANMKEDNANGEDAATLNKLSAVNV